MVVASVVNAFRGKNQPPKKVADFMPKRVPEGPMPQEDLEQAIKSVFKDAKPKRKQKTDRGKEIKKDG